MKQISLLITNSNASYVKTLPKCSDNRVTTEIMIVMETAKKEGVFYVDDNVIIPYAFTNIKIGVFDV